MTAKYIYATAAGVYATDGSSSGPTLLKANVAGTPSAVGFLPGTAMAGLPNGRVLFGATSNGSTSPFAFSQGIQLWISDGTVAGTSMLSAQIDPSPGQQGDTAQFYDFASFGTKVYYEYNVGFANGNILYFTDGTVAGTVQASPQNVDDKSIGSGNGALAGTRLVYATTAGIWATDASGQNAALIKPTVAGTISTLGFLPGYAMASLPNGRVLFGATGNGSSSPFNIIQGIQLWESDGTVAGTTQLSAQTDPSAGQPGDTVRFYDFTRFGTKVYYDYNFGAVDSNILYFTDGTVAGTVQASPQYVDDKSIGGGNGALAGTRLIYATTAGIWATDANGQNAALIKPTVSGTPNTLGFLPGYAMATLPNGRVVFGATGNGSTYPLAIIQGVQLWVTDGTAAGTSMIMALPDVVAGMAGDTAGLGNFVTSGNVVMFQYNDGSGGISLYSTDGTQAGTQPTGALVGASSVGFGLGASTACFAAGTRIMCADTAIAVEALRPGMMLRTASGPLRPVRWIGHRRVACRQHPRAWDVHPVHVHPHAFGDRQPARDLFLSPDHAVFVDGALIPIRYLINGATVVQEARDSVTYYHVELETHDVLLAEGLACESYLDTGNRGAFANGNGVAMLHPDFARQRWAADSCAPLVVDGDRLRAVRAHLLARATGLGHRTTDDPGLHLLADGVPLAPDWIGDEIGFVIPHGCTRLRLRSRSFVPAELWPDSGDRRRLGVAMRRLVIDGVTIAPLAGDGWHRAEDGLQWTDGDAALPQGGTVLELRLAPIGRYWRDNDAFHDERLLA